ncbi:MAG: GMC family oxidoreductase [Rhodothermaceae bacterium]|nr:GMC family oxidoreductase [Rhodothermaceae bacterium]
MKTFSIIKNEEYDAIVVGSGVAGGWAAKELTEKGLKTLVLERGREQLHGDYPTEHKHIWELEHRGRKTPEETKTDYPNGAISGPIKHFFAKDSEQPYVEDKPFFWVRGDVVGGRSLTWGRGVPRWSPMDFEAPLKDGHGIDWPIRYEDIEPWYEYVERFIGVNGEPMNSPAIRDNIFQKPMEMNAVEKHFRKSVEEAFPGRTMTIFPMAILTEALNGRAACHYCGPCARGCSTGSYFSSQSSTLPAAQATGNLTLRPDSVVHSILYDEEKDRAVGVRVVDRVTKEEMEVKGKLIFLCASALGSTQIMLNSKSNRFPNGIANSSGTLGHYLMDHHFHVGGSGLIPGFEDRYFIGNRPASTYIPRFRNVGGDTDQPNYVRGFHYGGGAGRAGWGRGGGNRGIGASLKESLREPGPWRMYMNAFGEMLPNYDNHVYLDGEKTDQWGIPLLHMSCELGENELEMRKDMRASAGEMLEAAGAEEIYLFDRLESTAPGDAIHEMGTARMGRDPKDSVLNGNNQAHDVPNLFVTDGACMTSSACQNPSITYMALTARACDFAVKAMQRGDLRV